MKHSMKFVDTHPTLIRSTLAEGLPGKLLGYYFHGQVPGAHLCLG